VLERIVGLEDWFRVMVKILIELAVTVTEAIVQLNVK
jgi:hypothetical protein